ncbi:DEAD/DEAH box helicase [Paenibacillus sp. GD4]|uniref:DEAD/DEAH box helicase n=1 Tax=Paenibacillus sp. GD4 TaxID=3068890 RepID=UPI002796D4BF|nr:DEAD/DEAH box helicase [Paenibacillus sp. GD4]MDQ1911508.1 DEAD/DEAH box helicase [Paenibacillus sp. GD4]
MGFLTEVQEIIMQTPTRRQTMLFSATMPDKIKRLARNYMRTPKEVAVQAKKITLEEIDQVVVRTTDRGKLDALCKTIDEDPPYLGMIFCRTKSRATKLNAELNERGYSSDESHGDLTQAKREQVMKRFRDAKIQLLVATDIAARGLDVEGITHVYNYDIPHDAESYIHRIGRTGRAGERGKAITFAAPRDADHLEKIERGIKQTLAKRQGRAPEGEQASRGRGGEQARAGRGGEQARAGRGGEQARAGRGGEQARAGRGGEQARAGRGGEQARVGRGGEQARVGRGGEQARAGRGGEQARAGRGGEQATRGRGGEQARAGRGGEQATRGRGGEQARGAGTAARGRGTDKAATWATGNPARAGVAARGRGADTKRGGANRSGGGRRGR